MPSQFHYQSWIRIAVNAPEGKTKRAKDRANRPNAYFDFIEGAEK
ncbi:MAG: hypothetical protein MjAS7_0148 [Metallosphaera javensis (ex Sakai et al. 2022)]|nr:MAG: hypothetical protein MjAS7_0148 [Metallosphaera javensis (ex Sakai et al. 2022)]